VREPVAAEVAFFEYGRAFNLAGDEWLRSRGHEEAIDDAREFVASHEQSRPAQRRAVGCHLSFQMTRVCRGSRPIGRAHKVQSRPFCSSARLLSHCCVPLCLKIQRWENETKQSPPFGEGDAYLIPSIGNSASKPGDFVLAGAGE
jgi:hypothetical protein